MKSLFITTALCLATLQIQAQHKVTGTVQQADATAIDYAEVYLIDPQGHLVKSTFTNEQGTFEIEDIANNTYSFQIHSMGIKGYEQQIEINNSKELGTFTLALDNTLGEIVVAAPQKVFERKADRTVFNIENSVHATNNDAIELLKLTPGIKVDQEAINLVGKGAVRVMINDKLIQLSGEELFQYLKSIPSENIQKVEVITTPPAKYEAEGNSGLINIVLKNALPEAWSNQISAGYKQSSKNLFKISDVFSYNKNKVSLRAGISAAKGGINVTENSTVAYPTETWNGESTRYNNNNYLSGNIQVDYQLSDKTRIGAQYNGGKGDPKFVDNGVITVNNNVNNPIRNIYSWSENTGVNNTQSVNLNLLHNIDTLGTKISADVDYFNYTNNKERLINSNTVSVDNSINKLSSANSKGDQEIQNFSAKVDLEHPLSWAKLSYGAKASFVVTNNKTSFIDYSTGTAIEDLNQKDNFQYKENTQAAYATLAKDFNDKWSAQVGLRLENTQTIGTSLVYNTEDKKNYTKLFPTIYASYKPNEDHTLAFNYNKRIARPAFWEINPFKWYITEYSVAQGNPALKPAFTDKVELGYTYKGKLDFSIAYTHIKDGYTQYPLVDPSTYMQVYVRDNILDTKQYSASVNYTFNSFPWLQSQTGLFLFQQKTKLIKDVNLELHNRGDIEYYFTTNNTFYLNSDKTWTTQLDFWYQPSIKANIWEAEESFSLNWGMKYSMLDKKLNLSLYVNDIFKSSATIAYTKTNGVNQKYHNYYDQRYFNLGVSYSFGNSKVKVRDHQGGNTEEVNRK